MNARPTDMMLAARAFHVVASIVCRTGDRRDKLTALARARWAAPNRGTAAQKPMARRAQRRAVTKQMRKTIKEKTGCNTDNAKQLVPFRAVYFHAVPPDPPGRHKDLIRALKTIDRALAMAWLQRKAEQCDI